MVLHKLFPPPVTQNLTCKMEILFMYFEAKLITLHKAETPLPSPLRDRVHPPALGGGGTSALQVKEKFFLENLYTR